MLEKSNDWQLLKLFFKKPLYSYHLREICRTLKWSPVKVKSTIEALKKNKLIVESHEKNLILFKSDRHSEAFNRYKRIYNLMRAFEVGELIEGVVEDFDAVVLFGSASRGEDVENSDFDVCVVGAKEVEVEFGKIEKELNRKISLLFVDNLEQLKKKNKELLNNLVNGFVIKGYLKVF